MFFYVKHVTYLRRMNDVSKTGTNMFQSNVLKMLLGTFEHYCNCDNQETRNASQESTHFSRALVVTTVHIQVTSV